MLLQHVLVILLTYIHMYICISVVFLAQAKFVYLHCSEQGVRTVCDGREGLATL